MVYNPAQLPSVVDNAARIAYSRRGVAHLKVAAQAVTTIMVVESHASVPSDSGLSVGTT